MKTLLYLLLLAGLVACGGSDPRDDGPESDTLPVQCAPTGCAK